MILCSPLLTEEDRGKKTSFFYSFRALTSSGYYQLDTLKKTCWLCAGSLRTLIRYHPRWDWGCRMVQDTATQWRSPPLSPAMCCAEFCCCLDAQLCPTLLQLHGLLPARLLSPWDFPGKNTVVVCHFLLQGIFPTWGSNLCLLHGRQFLYH